jgi:hypothetical protein
VKSSFWIRNEEEVFNVEERLERNIVLVTCTSMKQDHACEAKDLYISPLFRKMRQYAEKNSEKWFILSSKYHLVRPEDVIEPYDVTFHNTPAAEIKTWARETLEMLRSELDPSDVVTILAGKQYRRYLQKEIQEICREVLVPMENLGIGKQLQWLNRNLSASEAFPPAPYSTGGDNETRHLPMVIN